MAHIGEKNEIWLASSNDGIHWSNPPLRIQKLTSKLGLSLCSFNNQLCLAYVNKQNKVCFAASNDGVHWPHNSSFIHWENGSSLETFVPINLASFNNQLWLSYASDYTYPTLESSGKGGHIRILSSINGNNWTNELSTPLKMGVNLGIWGGFFGGPETFIGSAFVSKIYPSFGFINFNNELWLFCETYNGIGFTHSGDGTHWTPVQHINGWNTKIGISLATLEKDFLWHMLVKITRYGLLLPTMGLIGRLPDVLMGPLLLGELNAMSHS